MPVATALSSNRQSVKAKSRLRAALRFLLERRGRQDRSAASSTRRPARCAKDTRRGPKADFRIRVLRGGRFEVRDRVGRHVMKSGDSIVAVDSRAAAMAEAGDVVAAIERGLLAEAELVELGTIGREWVESRDTDAITAFKSVGLAIQDVAAAELVASRLLGNQRPD